MRTLILPVEQVTRLVSSCPNNCADEHDSPPIHHHDEGFRRRDLCVVQRAIMGANDGQEESRSANVRKKAAKTAVARSARSETEVFGDLEALCQTPDYARFIARMCLLDNMISHAEIKEENRINSLYGIQDLMEALVALAPGAERNEAYVRRRLWWSFNHYHRPVKTAIQFRHRTPCRQPRRSTFIVSWP